MIGALLVLALGASAATDPCAPVEPGSTPDPEAAAEYRAVGDAERAAGRTETAITAYRAAVQRDRRDSASASALEQLCAEHRRQGAYERGVQLMRSNDFRGAVRELEEARKGGDRNAALLEGICLYRLEDDGGAAPLLREAETDPANRESARFFLGLIAMRAGRNGEAARLLDQAAEDRELAPMARDLARAARRQGRVILSALAETGWDTNVDLTPDGSPVRGSAGDAAAGLAVALTVAPLGESGPYVRATGALRQQLQFDAFDTRAAGIAAGWQLGRGSRYVLAEYGYDYRDIGNAPYLSAQRLLANGRYRFAGVWSAGATYFARHESYLPAGLDGYSGWRQLAEADIRVSVGGGWLLGGGWRLGRDATNESALSWWEHGPVVGVTKSLGARTRLRAVASLTQRDYDSVDPVFGEVRSDTSYDFAALVEHDVASAWTLRFSLVGRKNTSNIPEFRYTTLAPTLGLAYTLGLL